MNCKSCNAEINWIKVNGKNVPIDAKPRHVYTSIEDEFGNVQGWELVNGYESHFATCPDAGKWRKAKQ